MSSIGFVPCSVCMSVPAGKQANTQVLRSFLATSSTLFFKASFPNFLKAALPKFFVTDFAITLPPAFK
jgi:hypothetical protein